jgi:ferredoxin
LKSNKLKKVFNYHKLYLLKGGFMKAYVDKDTCIGCGLCESTCPDVFEMKDNTAVVKGSAVPSGQEDCVKQMEKDCPVNAIKAQ